MLAGIAELAAGIISVVGQILTLLGPIIDFILTVTGIKGVFELVGRILKVFGDVSQAVAGVLDALLGPLISFIDSLGIVNSPLMMLGQLVEALLTPLRAFADWLETLPFVKEQKAAKAAAGGAVGGAAGGTTAGLRGGRGEEGTDFLRDFRSIDRDDVKAGVKDVMESFTSFNPLPVEDVSKGNFFSLGPAQRFFVQREATVNLQITADGNIDRQALAAAIQHPDVRQQLAQAVGLGNQADALVPRFAF